MNGCQCHLGNQRLVSELYFSWNGANGFSNTFTIPGCGVDNYTHVRFLSFGYTNTTGTPAGWTNYAAGISVSCPELIPAHSVYTNGNRTTIIGASDAFQGYGFPYPLRLDPMKISNVPQKLRGQLTITILDGGGQPIATTGGTPSAADLFTLRIGLYCCTKYS